MFTEQVPIYVDINCILKDFAFVWLHCFTEILLVDAGQAANERTFKRR